MRCKESFVTSLAVISDAKSLAAGVYSRVSKLEGAIEHALQITYQKPSLVTSCVVV